MSTVETLKKIIAPFVQLDPSMIDAQTVIDRRTIKGSIMVHRMYALLAREGFHVADRRNIGTFGDLKAVLDRGQGGDEVPAAPSAGPLQPTPALQPGGRLAIGIDMEEISNLPDVADFREDAFYRQNFSEREIAYCILQPDPLQSFAGKFCAKEAIVKADKSWRGTPFHRIEILNDADGTPCFGEFSLSISHTARQAIAIALKGRMPIS